MFNFFLIEYADNIFSAISLLLRSKRSQSFCSTGKLILLQSNLLIKDGSLLILCTFLPVSLLCVEALIDYARQQSSSVF